MGLFDVIEDISEKNISKTETGDNRIFGIVVGEVVDNYDQERSGRICVSIHTRDSEANVLKWAKVAEPYIGKEWGMYFLPEVGDQVLVAFDQGNIERPYVIGCIPKDSDKFLTKSKDEQNQKKRIVTRRGNAIEFFDGEPEEGSVETKDKITITTPESAHSITLNDEKKLITIKDKDGNCEIEMSTKEGQMTVNANKKLTLTVGDSIKITLSGDSGKITVEAKDVSIQSSGKMVLKGEGKTEITGANVTVESTGMVKVSAGGMLTAEGKPVKIG